MWQHSALPLKDANLRIATKCISQLYFITACFNHISQLHVLTIFLKCILQLNFSPMFLYYIFCISPLKDATLWIATKCAPKEKAGILDFLQPVKNVSCQKSCLKNKKGQNKKIGRKTPKQNSIISIELWNFTWV